MIWTQNYAPVGGPVVSTLLAAVPVVVLLGLLAFGHTRAHWAALAGLASSLAIALFVYHMPARLAWSAAGYGAAYGLFPIGWIVLCAIFVYDITIYTGQFEIVKHSIAGLADDRRIQAVLIAFCFGSFLEGAAGFGTPVAICAAMLIGLGFRPLHAAGLALIGNTAPVAFGGLGIPITTLSSVTGISPEILSAAIGRQLAVFGVIIPFWLVCAMAGWRAMLEVWPACLTAGLSFAIVQLAVSNLHGPWLVAISASASSILSVVVLLRFWKPKTLWRFDHEENDDALSPFREADATFPRPDFEVAVTVPRDVEMGTRAAVLTAPIAYSRRQVVLAWMPWVIVSVIVLAWGLKPVKGVLDKVQIMVEVPMLHQHVLRAPPVVAANAKPEEALFKFNWLSATGTSLLLAGIASGLLLGVSPARLGMLFCRTLHRVRWSLLTIAAMIALGYTTKYAGLDTTLGLAFAKTGSLFPFFSPLLGWLGVALTGSDTSSNILFGNLQKVTGNQLGISPVLAAASNSSGGVMGKMIDAQSIVVAGTATGQEGGEGQILRWVFFHSIALAVLVGVLALLEAYVLRWMVP